MPIHENKQNNPLNFIFHRICKQYRRRVKFKQHKNKRTKAVGFILVLQNIANQILK